MPRPRCWTARPTPTSTPAGRQEAQLVADRLSGEEVTAIYTSTLRRTARSAAPLAERTGVTLRVEADLREVHLGAWEGGRSAAGSRRAVDRPALQ